MKSPCKDCDKREMGCHSRCEGYKAYNEELEKERAKRFKRKRMEILKYGR